MYFLIYIYIQQLAYAAVLSTIYSLVMMLVIVGLLKQAADNGFCSVTTLFLCFVAGVFILAAFIHPQVTSVPIPRDFDVIVFGNTTSTISK